jgi:hypothetical protein
MFEWKSRRAVMLPADSMCDVGNVRELLVQSADRPTVWLQSMSRVRIGWHLGHLISRAQSPDRFSKNRPVSNLPSKTKLWPTSAFIAWGRFKFSCSFERPKIPVLHAKVYFPSVRERCVCRTLSMMAMWLDPAVLESPPSCIQTWI